MDKADILQDLSLEFNSMIKKNLAKIKKLDPKTQREIGSLMSDFKDGLDVLSESVVTEGRVSAKKLLQSVVDGHTDRVEGIKLSKEMAQSFLDWQRLSPFGKKYGELPFNKLFTAAFNWGLNRHADKKSKEYKELEAKAKSMR